MCDIIKSFVKHFDQLGVPVALNLKKENVHKTCLGGCCSIFAIALLVLIFIAQIMQVFVNLNYNETTISTFLRENDGHGSENISTDDLIPAVQIVSLAYDNSTLTISDYVTPFVQVVTST